MKDVQSWWCRKWFSTVDQVRSTFCTVDNKKSLQWDRIKASLLLENFLYELCELISQHSIDSRMSILLCNTSHISCLLGFTTLCQTTLFTIFRRSGKSWDSSHRWEKSFGKCLKTCRTLWLNYLGCRDRLRPGRQSLSWMRKVMLQTFWLPIPLFSPLSTLTARCSTQLQHGWMPGGCWNVHHEVLWLVHWYQTTKRRWRKWGNCDQRKLMR